MSFFIYVQHVYLYIYIYICIHTGQTYESIGRTTVYELDIVTTKVKYATNTSIAYFGEKFLLCNLELEPVRCMKKGGDIFGTTSCNEQRFFRNLGSFFIIVFKRSPGVNTLGFVRYRRAVSIEGVEGGKLS